VHNREFGCATRSRGSRKLERGEPKNIRSSDVHQLPRRSRVSQQQRQSEDNPAAANTFCVKAGAIPDRFCYYQQTGPNCKEKAASNRNKFVSSGKYHGVCPSADIYDEKKSISERDMIWKKQTDIN
jgi:hypothetical protein